MTINAAPISDKDRELIFAGTDDEIEGEPHILATGRLTEFRACSSSLKVEADGASTHLSPATARLLGLAKGDSLLAMGR